MQEFDRLFEILDRLLAPDGCPWDRKQTMMSLRYAIIEEVYEVSDAIEQGDREKIKEELGDLFFTLCFLCRLGEKQQGFRTQEVIDSVSEKLIRRHPHIFGDKKADDPQTVRRQWEEIKDKENGGRRKQAPFEGIPKALPALSKAQKVLKRLERFGEPLRDNIQLESEQECVEKLLDIAAAAQRADIDAEMVLRERLTQMMACDLSAL